MLLLICCSNWRHSVVVSGECRPVRTMEECMALCAEVVHSEVELFADLQHMQARCLRCCCDV